MRLPVAPDPPTSTPLPALQDPSPHGPFPERTFRAPAAVPPIVFPAASPTTTPFALPTAPGPAALSPTQLPLTTWRVAPASSRRTPEPWLPEMRFRAPLVVPPIV